MPTGVGRYIDPDSVHFALNKNNQNLLLNPVIVDLDRSDGTEIETTIIPPQITIFPTSWGHCNTLWDLI